MRTFLFLNTLWKASLQFHSFHWLQAGAYSASKAPGSATCYLTLAILSSEGRLPWDREAPWGCCSAPIPLLLPPKRARSGAVRGAERLYWLWFVCKSPSRPISIFIWKSDLHQDTCEVSLIVFLHREWSVRRNSIQSHLSGMGIFVRTSTKGPNLLLKTGWLSSLLTSRFMSKKNFKNLSVSVWWFPLDTTHILSHARTTCTRHLLD